MTHSTSITGNADSELLIGKTILSSTVLKNVLCQSEMSRKSAVLCFFFDFDHVEKQRHENITRSLVSQLSMHSGDESQILESLYSSCMDGERQPTYGTLAATLRRMMSIFEETFTVLDALDECRKREKLLKDIEEIFGWQDVNTRILATSRKERAIKQSMEQLTTKQERICLRHELIQADIRAYIHDRLQFNRRLKRWQKVPDLPLEVETALMSKADGM